MIALAAFVVVAHKAFAGRAKEQPVLVTVSAWWQGLGQFPNHDLDDRPIVANFLRLGDQRRFHILHDSNILPMCNRRFIA